MTCEEALAAIGDLKTSMHNQFDAGHTARLAQLDAALATASMAVEHLFDEDIRHNHDPKAHAKARGEYVRED